MQKDKNYFVHIPHSGLDIIESTRNSYYLNKIDLEFHIKKFSDIYTEELYMPLVEKANDFLIFPYSRLMVDVERFFDNDKESMAKKGLGWFYEKDFFGNDLRNHNDKDFLKSIYYNYHQIFHQKIDMLLKNGKPTTIIDCHSFSNNGSWYKEKKENYPDICIGYNEHNKDEEVIEKLKVLFKDYQIKENFPYNGSIYPLHFEHNKHLKTVMIEINKSLYIDEDTFEKKKEFEILKEKLNFFDFF